MLLLSKSLPSILFFALLASVLSLAGAYIAQYGFGLQPCHLCLAQRVPYAVVIALAALGLWQVPFQRVIIVIIGLAFLTGAGIASYHAAVEKRWVQGPSGCTDAEVQVKQTLDDFLKKVQHAPIVACDQPQWEFHGITMAGMSAVWSLLLAGATFAALRKNMHA